MALMPKRVKWRKSQRGKVRGEATKGNTVVFGEYGIQTLGVSARYTLIKNFPNWRKHRILFSLNNAELYLKPRHLFTSKNFGFFRKRLPGAFNQLAYRIKVMR